MNQTFGKNVDDKKDASPVKAQNSKLKSKTEAEKCKVEYNPKLSRKSRDLKSLGRSSSNNSPSPKINHNTSLTHNRSMTQSPTMPKTYKNQYNNQNQIHNHNTTTIKHQNNSKLSNGSTSITPKNLNLNDEKEYLVENDGRNRSSRNRSSRNSRLSKTMPKSPAEIERPLKDVSASIDNTKDEGIQMSPIVSDDGRHVTNETKDVGIQFTFEDRENRKSDSSKVDLENDIKENDDEENIVISRKKKKEKEHKDPPLYIFADEQGAGQLRAASELEDAKNRDSENTTEDVYKNSFGSRKTSLSKPITQIENEEKIPEFQREVDNTENTETKDEERNPETFRSERIGNITTERTNKKYKDWQDLSMFTLKDWKDSKIYKLYSEADDYQKRDFINYVIQNENESSENSIKIMDMGELNYMLRMLRSREYTTKRAVRRNMHPDGSTSKDFVKFDAYNVVELFETLKRNITYIYGLFGIEKYILMRVYGKYNYEDNVQFRTTENAIKL